MRLRQLKSMEQQLDQYVEGFKGELGRSERRYWCKLYVMGLLLDGERKSIEPMATRLPGGNEQALQQFVNQSPWHHESIQLKLLQQMHRQFGSKQSVLAVDDTAFPKQGQSSVGVARQYCGTLGKVANCQVAVTWHYCGTHAHFPLLGELFLPEAWLDKTANVQQTGVPVAKQRFREKWRIALALLDQIRGSLTYDAIVVDAGYGEIRPFLHALEARGQRFVAQIPESHGFWPMDVPVMAADDSPKPTGRPRQYPVIADGKTRPLSAKAWRQKLEQDPRQWRKVRLPLQRSRIVQVAAVRVRETISQAWHRPGPERWLLIERQSDGSYKYYLSNASLTTPVKHMIGWAHQRWKVEQGYQQMKEELGLDHFEGRSWRGFHHHLTLCFLAFCFLKRIGRTKKRLDPSQPQTLAQSSLQLDAMSALSKLPSASTHSPLRLNSRYLTE